MDEHQPRLIWPLHMLILSEALLSVAVIQTKTDGSIQMICTPIRLFGPSGDQVHTFLHFTDSRVLTPFEHVIDILSLIPKPC